MEGHVRTLFLACMMMVAMCSVAQPHRDYFKKPSSDKNVAHIVSSYDYAPLAAEITAGCADDYERIWAIYKWECDNIAYDTQYLIKTADECYAKRKGVCQAYCDLFYLLAKAVGIRAEIVGGISKSHTGNVSRRGHAWIFAYTRPDHGILLDPTWGAGFVDGREFLKRDDCTVWFNVVPQWMILSHFPDDTEYQLIDNLMTKEEFLSLKPVDDLWLTYGLDVGYIYRQTRSQSLSLPQFFSRGEQRIRLVDFPKSETLRVGQYYDFRIKVVPGTRFAFINDVPCCKTEEWTDEGDGLYSVRFMPRANDYVNLCLYEDKNDMWSTIVKYGMETPTAADWRNLEAVYPLCLPEAQAVENIDAEGWSTFGVDGHRLLDIIRREGLRELPALFWQQGQKLRIISVPMTRQLRVGQPVTFSFVPQSGIDWAVVEQGKWHRQWVKTGGTDDAADGSEQVFTMTLTPTAPGPLSLYVKMNEGKTYWQCIEYEVVPQ